MTLNDYLQAKYGVDRPTTMLGCEARAFGVPYPLRNGWLQQHGHVVISPDTAAKLRSLLERNGSDSAQRGIKVLDKAWLELKSSSTQTARTSFCRRHGSGFACVRFRFTVASASAAEHRQPMAPC